MSINENWKGWNNWKALPKAQTYYFDPLNGNDSNAGTDSRHPWKTQVKAEALALSSGEAIYKKIDDRWILFKMYSPTQSDVWVYGYYQDGGGTLTVEPDQLQLSAFTHIAHDHMEPYPDGRLDDVSYGLSFSRSQSVVATMHAAGTKCMLVVADIIGTWDGVSYNKNGSQHRVLGYASAVTDHCETLITNMLDAVLLRGYDGIDIDWENGNTSDRMVQLMAQLYPALKNLNPNFVVNMAVGVSPSPYLPCLPYTDKLGVMCYGVYLLGSKVTWPNAPLFDGNYYNGWGNKLASSSQYVLAFLKMGVPPEQLFLGCPFFATRTYRDLKTDTHGPLKPRQPYTFYTWSLVAGASYTVRLHFAETQYTTAGKRTFNVLVNKQQILTNFDVFAAAGGRNKAIVKEFSLPADEFGEFLIEFVGVIGSATCCGVEVLGGQDPLQINCGGTSTGAFSGDTAYSGGDGSVIGATVTTTGVISPAPAALYQSERLGTYFNYNLPGGFQYYLGYGHVMAGLPLNYIADIPVGGYYSPQIDHWDAETKTPYLSLANADPTLNAFLSYDDPASLTAKIEWAKSRALGGLGIWEVCLDQINNRTGIAKTPLSDSLRTAYNPIRGNTGVVPSQVTGLVAAKIGTASIDLRWKVVPNATHYRIKRATVSGGPYTTLHEQSYPGFTDSTVAANTHYYYIVTSVNWGTEGTPSAELSVTSTAIAAPTNLITAPTDLTNAAWSITGTGASKTAATVHTGTAGGNTVLLQDLAVTASTTYVVTVTLKNTTNSFGWGTLNLAYLNLAGFWDSAVSGTADDGSTITFVGHALNTGVATTYRMTFNSGTYTGIELSLDFPDGANNIDVHVDHISIVATTGNYLPLAPTNLSATAPVATNTFLRYSTTLNWTWAAGAQSYNIWRSVGDGGKYMTFLANVTAGATSYTDHTINPSANWYYTVSAVYGSYESLPSTAVSVLTPADYNPPNVLASPSDLTNSTTWVVSGTGAAVTAANKFRIGSSTTADSFLAQNQIAVEAGRDYVCSLSITMPSTAATFVLVTIYDITFTATLASKGLFVTAGSAATWRMTFNSQTYTNLAFSIDFAPLSPNAIVQIDDLVICANLPEIPVNLLSSPNNLTTASWTVANATVLDKQRIQGSADTINQTALTQTAIACEANTDYTAAVTVQREDSNFDSYVNFGVLLMFGTGYTPNFGMQVSSLLPGQPTDLYIQFNSGDATSLLFNFLINQTEVATSAPIYKITKCSLTKNLFAQAGDTPIIDTSAVSTPVTDVALSAISLAANTVVAGGSTTVTATVNTAPGTDITVALESTNGAVTVPISLAILAGQTTGTATISTSSLASGSSTISIGYNGVILTAILNVTPAMAVNSVVLSPTTLVGGNSIAGTVTLNQTAPTGGTVVTLSDNSTFTTTPASVTIAAGQSSAGFTITSSAVTSNTLVTVTATYSGVSKTATTTLQPVPAGVSTLTLNPTTVVQGASSTATVTLGINAPTGGTVVTLSSNNSTAVVPATVTVAAGGRTATFTVSTVSTAANVTATITATAGGTSATAALSVLSAATLAVQIASDMWVGTTTTLATNEGHPHGVPSTWDFYSTASISEGNTPPSGWTAAIPWGTAYLDAAGDTATNTRVNIRNLQLWILSKSTGKWTKLVQTNTIDNAAYFEDFSNDASIPADVRTETDGSISFGSIGKGTYAGHNVHFYTTTRFSFTPSDVGGWFSMFEARLIRGSTSLPDDTANAKLLCNVGADYWQSLTSAMPAGSTVEPAIAGNKYKYVKTSWRSFCMTTVSLTKLQQSPPSVDLSGDLP